MRTSNINKNRALRTKDLSKTVSPNPVQSYVWLIGRALELRSQFFETLKKKLNEYNIEGGVFACSEQGLVSLDAGYLFIPEDAPVSEDLSVFQADFNIFENAIYIEGNKIRQGMYYSELGKVPSEKGIVLDLAHHTIL